MIYLLIFYWIFAALFCFGATYAIAKLENRNIFGVFLGCLVTGGILFPMYLGRNLKLDNMSKFCTSIEQSKKLLSLGLDLSTADMCWIGIDDDESFNGSWEVVPKNSSIIATDDKPIPCWSLTALLELMPLFIRINNEDYNFSLVRGGAGAYTFSYTHNLKEPWELGYDLHLTTHKDFVINAAFEMVCWLIEQEYIKVNK